LASLVTAMMDVSDGLLLDAFRLAEASGVSLAIDSASVPVADVQRRLECMTWGDDYELLFTLPPRCKIAIDATRIGTGEPRGFAPLFLEGEAGVGKTEAAKALATALDARLIRWELPALLAGAPPLYRLERLSGRYGDIKQEREAQRTVPDPAADALPHLLPPQEPVPPLPPVRVPTNGRPPGQ